MKIRDFFAYIKKVFTKKTILQLSLIVGFFSILFSLTLIIANNIDAPIKIYNANGLDQIRDDLSGNYLIMNDLSMSDYKDSDGNQRFWTPIGTKEQPFSGRIDLNYKTIIDLSFSDEYISDSINSDVDCVPIGFLGYSTGTIIHANFYRPMFPNVQNIQETDKTIIYGTICAINEGYVTSCVCTITGNGGTFSAKNLIFGSLVGENKKQILNCKCLNSITVNSYDSAIVGGIVGINNEDAIVSYVVRRGYTTIWAYNSAQVIAGGIIGTALGGVIDNVFHGPTSLKQRESMVIKSPNKNNSRCFLGGIIGQTVGISGSISIKNAYTCNKLSFSNEIESFSFGGLIALNSINESTTDSCLSDSFYVVNNPTDSNSGIFIGVNTSNLSINNCFYANNGSVPSEFNRFFSQEVIVDDSLILTLGWPTNTKPGYWSFNGELFCLNIL